jgi:hypothetical protein
MRGLVRNIRLGRTVSSAGPSAARRATRDGVGRYDSVMMRDGNLVVKDFPITDCNATNDYTIG